MASEGWVPLLEKASELVYLGDKLIEFCLISIIRKSEKKSIKSFRIFIKALSNNDHWIILQF